ncbi:MAG: hypothetical protein SNJ62_06330, partial [Chloracidobacterium sp.]
RPAELAAGHALVGPHRDDLAILMDGRDVARFGSAGQQRSALLALTLGQLALYRERCAEPPVFLLDDLDAELDAGRIATLLDYLQDKAQTFVTTTKPGLVNGPAHRQQLHAGRFVYPAKDAEDGQMFDTPLLETESPPCDLSHH